MPKHLAIFDKNTLNQILKGHKTIESRFSQKKIPPFGQINVGDTVYLKQTGEEIIGQFLVKQVVFFDHLGKKEWEIIKTHYWPQISFGDEKLDQKFIESHQSAKYATLIFIDKVEQFITPPVKIRKRDQRGWVVL